VVRVAEPPDESLSQGSKPLLATFLAGLCPYCNGPLSSEMGGRRIGKLVDSPITPSCTQSEHKALAGLIPATWPLVRHVCDIHLVCISKPF
jgi:hypothetical protein